MLHQPRIFLAFFVVFACVSCGQADTIETTPPEKEIEVTTTTATTTTTTVDPSVALAAGLEYSVAWLSYVFPKAAAVQHADAAQTNGVTKPPGYDGCSGSRNGEGLTGGALSCEPVPSTGNGASGTPAPTGITFTDAMPAELVPFFTCVAKHESGGNYNAVNPSGKYRGRYQADRSFFLAYAPAEFHYLADPPAWETAPEWVQDTMAVNGFRARGASPWMGICREYA